MEAQSTSRKVTVTLTEEQWRSVIAGEFRNLQGFDEGVVEAISQALCPDGHEIEITYKIQTSTTNYRYAWFFGNCPRCNKMLWGIWHASFEKRAYRYWDAITDTQTIFLPGGPDDPNKVDIYNVIETHEDTHEWLKL